MPNPRRPIQPGEIWFVDFEPVRGREQGRDRAALVVSSPFHLAITMGQLVTVLPLTSVERPGWTHRIAVTTGPGWVITEQIRTVSANRFRRPAPDIRLAENDLAEVRHVLAQMLTI
ncbi:MAG TPA: type II toxin-antitoxin system PemK/MazF family toxin [Mycobacteriales bacterium]|nr:type II toxin-antitoxin system PemK/MazF family toxin [Mycobacteriales bacterium]